jgi:hypothetical protein
MNALELPPFLESVKNSVNIPLCYENATFEETLDFYMYSSISSQESYFIFFALWCYSIIENISQIDLLINIDILSSSNDYRIEIENSLKELGISGLDFSDAKSPCGFYSEEEKEFFLGIEKQVMNILSSFYSESEVNALKNLRDKYDYHRKDNSIDYEKLKKDISILRQLVRTKENEEILFRNETNYLKSELKTLKIDNKLMQAEIEKIYKTYSWKITKPLRWLKGLLKK